MGNSISNVHAAAMSKGREQEELSADALTSLKDLATLKTQLFGHQVRREKDLSEITSRKFLAEGFTIRCDIPCDDAASIARYITTTFPAIADSHVADAISSVLSISLKAMVKSDQRTTQMSEYFVVVGDLCKAYRVDLSLYAYQFRSRALQQQVAQNVMIVSAVLSSIDLSRVDNGILGGLLQSCYWAAPRPTQERLVDKLKMVKLNSKLVNMSNDSHIDAKEAFLSGLSR